MIASTRLCSLRKAAATRLLFNRASATTHLQQQQQQRQQQRQQQERSYFVGPTSPLSDRIVVAVGGNALQRRGERLTIENMLKAAAEMAPTIVNLVRDHELVLTHGNGPQVGELALERSAARCENE